MEGFVVGVNNTYNRSTFKVPIFLFFFLFFKFVFIIFCVFVFKFVLLFSVVVL